MPAALQGASLFAGHGFLKGVDTTAGFLAGLLHPVPVAGER